MDIHKTKKIITPKKSKKQKEVRLASVFICRSLDYSQSFNFLLTTVRLLRNFI